MELIDRDALLEAYDREHVGAAGRARKLIEDAPTVDAVTVVHGHWIYDASDMRCVCSECNHHLFQIVRPFEFKSFVEQNKFCFNCGSDMRERKTDENTNKQTA